MAVPEKYVLMTETGSYFVEYLLGQLILSPSISEALVFTDSELARKFQNHLYKECQLFTSVNRFIDIEN